MTAALAIAGIAVSGGALLISAATALFLRRQLALAERHRARDFAASVVAELVEVGRCADALHYEIAVINAGPAVARDVDVAIVEWVGDRPIGRTIAEASVAPALLRGERRVVALSVPSAEAKFDDREVSIELHADYYDDNGSRNERLALVYEDSLLLMPPAAT